MKYVMFTHVKMGLRLSVLFAEVMTHADIKPPTPDWVATSAGFFSSAHAKVHGCSTSLGLTPLEVDGETCMLVVGGLESMMYALQDTAANLEQLQAVREGKNHNKCQKV